MKNASKFHKSLAVLACSQVLSISLATGAENQDTGSQQVTDENDNKIIITGSRIKQNSDEATASVITVTRTDIQNSSADNLSDLLKELSVTHGGEGSFATHASGALQADSPVGTAAVSLRGLGASSTLVLINGKRVAANSFAFRSQNFVDINAIPMAAIERVEILASGASAIYGADAVAGVVNIVLRRDIEKSELTLSYGNSTASSNDGKINASLVWSTNTETSDITVIADYYKKETLYDRDREQTAHSNSPSEQGIWPSFNEQYFDDHDYVEASCPDETRFDDRSGFPNSSFGEYCSYDQNQYLPTYPGIESLTLGAFTDTELSATINWRNEIYYSHTESQANSSSAPFSGVEVPFDHPNMPAGLTDRFNSLWNDLGVPPEDFLLMWGRFDHPRTLENKTNSYRLVSSLEGELGDWDFDASLLYANSQSEQRGTAGIINRAKFEAALFGELCNDGSIGCSPGVDGVYFNPFNGQRDNAADIYSLIEENVPRDGSSTMYSADFNLSGDIGILSAGAIQAAFGVEIRKEKITDEPSALALADPANFNEVPVYGFGSTAAAAERNIAALYGEIIMPLAQTFDLHLAGRIDDYSDFGNDFNPKIGFSYALMDALKIKGSWSTSFRAPSLSQIGAGTTLSSGSLDCSAEFFDTFCGGFGGSDGYLSEIYGNPNLEAEESEAWNLGFFGKIGDDIELSMDYWSFNHDNIVGTDDEQLFRSALAGNVPVVATDSLGPDQIGIETRTGVIGDPIDEIHLQLENLGEQKTRGLDATYTQYFEMDNGTLALLIDATRLFKFERQLSKNAVVEDLEGTFRYPQLLARTRLRWRNDDWSVTLTANFTSSYEDDLEKFSDDQLANFGIARDRKIPSWLKWSSSLGWDFNDASWINLKIDNLFDVAAPLAYGTSANVDHFNHSTMGRFYQLTFVQKF